jgi:putative transposase
VIVEYIDQYRHEHGVEPICEALKDTSAAIAPSTYYAAKAGAPSARAVSDAATLAKIKKVHQDNYGVYGARKVHAQLRRDGHPVARCTVERLMRASGIRGISRAKSPRTTIPAPAVKRPWRWMPWRWASGRAPAPGRRLE